MTNLTKQWSQTYKTKFELLEENKQLKELLKECRYEIHPSYIEVIGGTKTFKNLVNKINQALGEE